MLQIAQKFATLIDQTKFDEVLPLMAEDCEYHYWEGNYVGRENIVKIYRHMHVLSGEMFDEIKYASQVEQVDAEHYIVHFLDTMRMGDRWHDHYFDEVIGFKDNLICDIQNIQLPGEAESFREFYQEARAEAVA